MRAQTIDTQPVGEDMVEVINPDGAGDFVLVCEHASNYIPPELDNLGLDKDLLSSHIAWDSGAMQVAKMISERLDAPLVAPGISRLVYDCNRAPGFKSCVPSLSERHEIPGNVGVSKALCDWRARRYYTPFINALHECLNRNAARDKKPVLMTIHSFTPVFKGVKRSLDIGLIHDDDMRFAEAMLQAGYKHTGLKLGINQPYGPDDGVTHTLKEHAIKRGLLNVMVEIRNDLIADGAAQQAMAAILAKLSVTAFETLAGNFK